MHDRIITLELRALYALAFIAVGYTLGVCFPAIQPGRAVDALAKAIDSPAANPTPGHPHG